MILREIIWILNIEEAHTYFLHSAMHIDTSPDSAGAIV